VPVDTWMVSHWITRRGINYGFSAGLLAGGIIGLPPVLNFGRPELQKRIVPEVLQAKKFICLAISEAFAGSDVTGRALRSLSSSSLFPP
jgi:alkylation response protein AidB-like acyl-CoA dehydrogenase